MSRTRTDTLEHLIEDLRRDNPRLVVIFGEMHECMEGRKLIHGICEQADVGFLELPNACGDKAGHPCSKEEAKTYVRTLEEAGAEERELVEARLFAAPKVAVAIDSPTKEAKHAWLAGNAIKRMKSDKVPEEDPIYQAVETVLQHSSSNQRGDAGKRYLRAHNALKRMIEDGASADDPDLRALSRILSQRMFERVRDSNKDMASAAVHYLDEHHGDGKPFFATMLVGRNHIKRLKQYGLEDSDSDIRHVLQQHGYTTVTIELSPSLKLDEQPNGDYMILPATIFNHGIDYVVDIADERAQQFIYKGESSKHDLINPSSPPSRGR